jgi:hypothetical protein
VDSPASVGSGGPGVAKLVLSPTLIPDAADMEEKPAGLLSPVVPNTDGGFTWVVVAPVVVALLKGFAVGCVVGAADELFSGPKLNVSFGGSDEVAAAGEGLDGGGAACLFVIPNLNFSFDASPVSPAEGGLALRSELVVVKVEEVGLVNENRFEGAGPLPCKVPETFVGLLSGGFVCPKLKNEGVVVPFVAANEGIVVGGAFCAKGLGMVEGPLAAGVEAEVCTVGIGAGEKENEGNDWVVLVSGLPFASPDWVFEDNVNKEGGRVGSVTCVLAFGGRGRENGDAAI